MNSERRFIVSNKSQPAWHVTPINGNVFLDLGFDPAEAERLLLESNRRIAEKIAAQKERQGIGVATNQQSEK